MHSPCLEHQDHLIAHGGMKLVDALLAAKGEGWGYFSTLAKICNTWRDRAPKVLEVWQATFGHESAHRHAVKLTPK
eukprot:14382986-Alexandrium_andersonii.AAC.1